MSSFKIRGVNFILIRYDNKILIQKRSADAPISPNAYCFPGGAIDLGETPDEAVVREIVEETGVKVNRLIFFCGFDYFVFGEKWNNIFYLVRVKNPEIVSTEGEMIWFSIEEAKNLKLLHEENELLDIIKSLI